MEDEGTRLVGVYASDGRARIAVRALRRAGVATGDIRIGDDRDHLASLVAEMRAEPSHHSVERPRVARPPTETIKGMALGAIAGLLVSLPFAAIPFGDFGVWTRLLIVAVTGAVVGTMLGGMAGGAYAARRPDEQLAAEQGVTVAAPATAVIELALLESEPLRLDLVAADGVPLRTIATSDGDHVERDITSHCASEEPAVTSSESTRGRRSSRRSR